METLKSILIFIIMTLITAIIGVIGFSHIKKTIDENNKQVVLSQQQSIKRVKQNNQDTPKKNPEVIQNPEPISEPDDSENIVLDVPEIQEETTPELPNNMEEVVETIAEDSHDQVIFKEKAQDYLLDLFKLKEHPKLVKFKKWDHTLLRTINNTSDDGQRDILSRIHDLGIHYATTEWRETEPILSELQYIVNAITINTDAQQRPPKIDIKPLYDMARTVPVIQVYFDEAYNLVKTNIESNLIFPKSVHFAQYAVYDHIKREGDSFFIESFFLADDQDGLQLIEYSAEVVKYYHGYSIKKLVCSDYSVFQSSFNGINQAP